MIRKENQITSEMSGEDFPHNRYEALEESRRLLGISEPDFRTLLRIIGKAEVGHLNFRLGRLCLSLSSYGEDEVCLGVGLGRGSIEKSAEYKFSLSEIGLPKRQSNLLDFGDE